jgi:hypothetical protein
MLLPSALKQVAGGVLQKADKIIPSVQQLEALHLTVRSVCRVTNQAVSDLPLKAVSSVLPRLLAAAVDLTVCPHCYCYFEAQSLVAGVK